MRNATNFCQKCFGEDAHHFTMPCPKKQENPSDDPEIKAEEDKLKKLNEEELRVHRTMEECRKDLDRIHLAKLNVKDRLNDLDDKWYEAKKQQKALEKQTLDLTKYKTPKTAAKKLYEFLRKKSQEMGQNSDKEIFLWSPTESKLRGQGSCWTVCWESGPFEWAVFLSNGGSMIAGEVGIYNYKSPAEVKLLGSKHWHTEPYFSFSLGFYED